VVIDSQSLPKGRKTIDGVPFIFIDGDHNLVDVCPSMRGFTEGNKLKYTYLGGRNPKLPAQEFPRVKFQVPSDDYTALHLVAFSATRPDTAARMTVRVGSMRILEKATCVVPAATGTARPSIFTGNMIRYGISQGRVM
jgi:hypothetical protein